MSWDDLGFLLSKTNIVKILLFLKSILKIMEKYLVLSYGGTSKKIKNYLQIGNQIYVNYNSKI